MDGGAISGPTEAMEEFVKELRTRVKITFEKNVKEYTGIGIDCVFYGLTPRGSMRQADDNCFNFV